MVSLHIHALMHPPPLVERSIRHPSSSRFAPSAPRFSPPASERGESAEPKAGASVSLRCGRHRVHDFGERTTSIYKKRHLVTGRMWRAGKRPYDWIMKNTSAGSKGGYGRKVVEVAITFVEVLLLLVSIAAALVESIVTFFLPHREKDLSNDIILVTGTGHGIGRDLIVKLAAEGATVIGWDLSEEGNAETLKILKDLNLHHNTHFYECNVANREDVLKTAAKVRNEVGDVTILVNNAGIMCCKPLQEQGPDTIERVFKVNAISNFWTIEAFLPKMKERNSGHLVSTCSMCGVIGLPYAVPYCASKFAVRGMMEALYEELRRDESTCNIKFTTIYPITVDTGLAKKPRHRFPSLFSILEPEAVASQITSAIKRETYELALPTFMMTFDRVTRLMPRKIVEQMRDFLDTGVDPE
ncbi:oxidoreductase activity [Nesidiocoris tenuis]|uniref:Oxidoreductase activity n=1 Tax=Nesidiocoris tenuis TaxID=355587 RepID=A0ABN7AJ27_9HEMI|nr:oxidoreductase activity [Nesidiocoris tenuis]